MNNHKSDFPVFASHPELVYLDNAATSQTPEVVLKHMDKYYKEYRSNVHRGLYPEAEQATEEYEKARAVVADFLNANEDEVIFTSGATASMNKLVSMLEHSGFFEAGDEIVTTELEHHAVLVPLLEVAKRCSCSLLFAPLRENMTLDEDALLKLVGPKTKLVALSMASNVLGSISDVGRVCEGARDLSARAAEAGALVVVDAAKAAGHLPIDVKDIGCDFLFFSGHKMCGPTGVGVLYGQKKHLDELAPGTYGGGMIRTVNRTEATFAESPERFEAGTPPIAEAIGLAAATRYLNDIGLKKIHQHIVGLVDEAITTLKDIKKVKVFAAPAEQNAGVVSFLIDGIHPHDVAEILGREGVAVRAGHHCAEPLMRELGVKSLTRASFSFYNTSEDIERLKEAIEKAIKTFS